MIDAATATVRDHIEKVVESLVGENLDIVNIVRLSTESNCKYLSSACSGRIQSRHSSSSSRRQINFNRQKIDGKRKKRRLRAIYFFNQTDCSVKRKKKKKKQLRRCVVSWRTASVPNLSRKSSRFQQLKQIIKRKNNGGWNLKQYSAKDVLPAVLTIISFNQFSISWKRKVRLKLRHLGNDTNLDSARTFLSRKPSTFLIHKVWVSTEA